MLAFLLKRPSQGCAQKTKFCRPLKCKTKKNPVSSNADYWSSKHSACLCSSCYRYYIHHCCRRSGLVFILRGRRRLLQLFLLLFGFRFCQDFGDVFYHCCGCVVVVVVVATVVVAVAALRYYHDHPRSFGLRLPGQFLRLREEFTVNLASTTAAIVARA